MLHKRVLMLRLDESAADLNGGEFVSPDRPIEDLLPAGRRVEAPPSALPDDRDRERPVVVTDVEGGAARVLRIRDDGGLLASLGGEGLGSLPVLGGLTRRDEVIAVRTEDRLEGGPVEAPGRRDQGIGGFLGRGKRPLDLRGGRNRLLLGRGPGDAISVQAHAAAHSRWSERKRCDRSRVGLISRLLLIFVYRRRPPPPPERPPLRAPALEDPLELLDRALAPL